MDQWIFLAVLGLQFFQGGKYNFTIRPQFICSQKQNSWFFRVVKTQLDTVYHSIRKDVKLECSVSVDCQTSRHTAEVKLYCQMTAQRRQKHPLHLKTENHDQVVVLKKKNESVLFSGMFKTTSSQLSLLLSLPSGSNSQVHKKHVSQ